MFETEARLQNGGDKKGKIELVTIYQFSNMIRRKRGSPNLGGAMFALGNGIQKLIKKTANNMKVNIKK
jgi:hypothetical protein